MRIKALRVSEVGCFRDGVAIEGLSGALDVLAGANESGKSTLLGALDTVFGEKHTSGSAKLKDQIQPYAGGAPLIEVEFALKGADWRLRKRYFAGRLAELRNLTTGEVVRNADAEELLERLLSAGGTGAIRGALWVKQKAALEPLDLGVGSADALQSAMAREIAAAISGGRLRAVAGAVGKALDALVSGARESKRGAFKDAAARAEKLGQDRTEAQRAAGEADQRMQALGLARAALAALDGPAAASERAARLEAAQKALAEAREASGKRKLAEAEWRRLDQLREAALRADQQMAGQIAELTALAATGAEAALDDLRARVIALRGAAADAHKARQAAVRHHESARHAEAAALAITEHELRAGVAAHPVERALLDQIETAARDVAALEAEISAARPRVAIDYARGAEGRIHLDGASHPGGEFELAGPIELAIPGIGRIRIRPGASATAAAAHRRLGEERVRLASLLARAGANTLTAARDSFATRRDLSTRLEQVSARRAALRVAPDTSAGKTAGGGLSPADLVAREAETRRCDGVMGEASAAAARADDALRLAETVLAQGADAQAGASARRAVLTATLPPEAERAAHRQVLAADAAATAKAAGEALLVLEAWRAKEPAADALAKLEQAHAGAEAALAAAAARRRQLELEIAGLEAGLARDTHDGIGERLTFLSEQHDAAEAALAGLTARVRSLRLLAATLATVTAESETHVFRPVLQRMAPYMHALWPEAAIDLASGFAITGLRRAGNSERPEQLSIGTQEQVAILARLGFAALAADLGEALPVILDDALVYSDDERIERLFGVLRQAARRHQVIVFTCRMRAWDALGGHRLGLSPWRVGADA